jgi:hypothetical protein
LIDDSKLLSEINEEEKCILVKSLEILTKNIDKKILLQDKSFNELNFENWEKNISGPLLYFIKRLIINNSNSNNFKFISDNNSVKKLYKKLLSCCVISNQIANCRNKIVDTCNFKKNFTFFLKYNHLSNSCIKNLSRIGLCSSKEIDFKKQEQIHNFNNKKLDEAKNEINKQLLLLISDNKFFMNKNPIFDETHEKSVIQTTKTVTKVFRVPTNDFKLPDEKLKLMSNFQSLIKNKINKNDKQFEKNIILNNLKINEEEENEFLKLNDKILIELKNSPCNINFYKQFDSKIQLNNDIDETSKTFIIKSSLCGDDSAEDNLKVFKDFIEYFNSNVGTKFDETNFKPFVEVDGKGYGAFRKLINNNKIDVNLCPGTFHLMVNIMKV